MSKASCLRCHKLVVWPEAYCSPECRSLGTAAPVTPMSVPVTVMRARPMNVREAETVLSDVRSPEGTRRLQAAEEQDVLIWAALAIPNRRNR